MNPGDLARVRLPGSTKLALIIKKKEPSHAAFVSFWVCLVDGKIMNVPVSWLKVIDEAG